MCSVGELEHTSFMLHATGQVNAGIPSPYVLLLASELVLTKMECVFNLEVLYNSTSLAPFANTDRTPLALLAEKNAQPKTSV